jgi:hypothetical protein
MNVKDLLDIPPWQWPSNAGRVLLKCLVDRQADPEDRLIAAELAGDLVVMNDELAESLLQIVLNKNEPDDLRGGAAIGLGPVLEQADVEYIDDEFDDAESVPITPLTFRNIRESLHKVYLDESNPKEVRRRVLEGSVRSPQDWHRDAIRAAYSSGDKGWVLTAVFAMRYVRGFDDLILEGLRSADPEVHFQAVCAAGNWGLDAAWPHVVQLVQNSATRKPLLLAAIEAVGNIRPKEAGEVLMDLADSDDEEIAEAAEDAVAMAQAMSSEADDDEEDDEDDEEEWVQ